MVLDPQIAGLVEASNAAAAELPPIWEQTVEQRRQVLAAAIHEAHLDDPEFGYRFLADEVRLAGHEVCDRTVWRICSTNGWWASFANKKRRKGSRPGTPAHDDLVRRDFTADAPNRVWLSDITEHRTA